MKTFEQALKEVTGLDSKPETVKLLDFSGMNLAVVERFQKDGWMEKRTNFYINIPRDENGVVQMDKFVENVSEAIRRYDLTYCQWGVWNL